MSTRIRIHSQHGLQETHIRSNIKRFYLIRDEKKKREIQKSLQLAKKIDSINSIDDFLKLVKGVPQDVAFFSSSSKNYGSIERNST
ncbi:hypothetical protein APICC_08014 [Apis cerana cerana]|uniref:Uncharacterized protein n=1 Tax=Apis cerana cerana TaxID=94128 RepID=A0A2A3ET09_APICC|nr:hypothetical protein APICC_08014 [Apis cerana cerana]